MTSRAGDEAFVKVRLTSDDGRAETLWAVRVGDAFFELRNVPTFAYGISDGDVVEGVEYASGMYDFVRVVRPSGNRTVRVYLAHDTAVDTESGKAVLAGLNALGCTYENFNGRVIGVVVPPGVDLNHVGQYLNGTGVIWESVNPTYEELMGQ